MMTLPVLRPAVPATMIILLEEDLFLAAVAMAVGKNNS
jgi:hypothetical protein